MEISLGQQTGLLFFALLFGAFLGLFYDTGRILGCLLGMSCKGKRQIAFSRLFPFKKTKESKERRSGKRMGAVLLFFSDFLFMVLSGIFFCVFVYAVNDGVFRFYILFGTVMGFFLYRFTLGRIPWFFASYIIAYTRLLLSWVLFCVLLPLRWICRFFAILSRKMQLQFTRVCGMIVRKTSSAIGYRRISKQDLKKMGISYEG